MIRTDFIIYCKRIYYGIFVKLKERIDQIIFIPNFQFVILYLFEKRRKGSYLSEICKMYSY